MTPLAFTVILELATVTLSAQYVSVAIVVLAISLIGFSRVREMVSRSYGGRAIRGFWS